MSDRSDGEGGERERGREGDGHKNLAGRAGLFAFEVPFAPFRAHSAFFPRGEEGVYTRYTLQLAISNLVGRVDYLQPSLLDSVCDPTVLVVYPCLLLGGVPPCPPHQ